MGEVCTPRLARGSTNEPYTVPLAAPRERWQYRLLVVAWLVGQVSFWSWWLQGDHVVTLLGMFLNSLLLLWTTFLPAWFLFFLGRAKQPNPKLPLPKGRVAMVTTRAPSEPWPLVRKTVEAMLAQDFPRPYDVWLADEDPTPAIRAWCSEHGVQVSCRKGVAGYNNRSWPRREKCKEGNLAYFYEVMGGYDRYDFVSQLDADHVPEPTYLAEMIRPFIDPTIGYVAAPSVCDANADACWAARGRLYSEAAWHGALQAGYNADFAPQCIGSHYAVRTSALRASGGLGPELAEDFSTTLLMNTNGWRGAFALNAAAHGDGPATLADCITQEFQWCRSVVNIFLSLWPGCSRRLPWHLLVQLGFAQIWYGLFTLHMLMVYAMPLVALATGTPWVDVNLPQFMLRATIPTLVALLTLIWTRRQGWLRPVDAPVLSWEAILFEYVRWPWMVLGIAHALVGHILQREFTFRVTPKGAAVVRPVAQRVLLPYFVIVAAEAGATILVQHPGDASGYAYLAWFAAASYTVVIVAVVALQLHENARRARVPLLGRAVAALRSSATPVLSSLLVGAAMLVRGEAALAAVVTPGADSSVVSPFNGAAAVVLQNAAAQKPSVTVAPAAQPDDSPTDVDPTAVTPDPVNPILPMDLATDHLNIGAYDPELALADQPLNMEQWYVPQNDPQVLAGALAHAEDQRTPLVTIEPWPTGGSTDVLDDVVSGKSDDDLRQLAQIAAASQPQVVLVRWGHEMELANLYPWSAQDPARYQQAFRHVVEIFREEGATNVRFVWSPAGNANALDYYPGNDVVDYVGMTVLEDAGWDAGWGLAPQTFDEVFGPRYRLLAPLGKPMIISEMGVSGAPDYQASWLTAAGQSLANYPGLVAVLYFDDSNPHVNAVPTAPDWRLGGPALSAFVNFSSDSAMAGGTRNSA
jgi:cellulose synthase (UDP-forming)